MIRATFDRGLKLLTVFSALALSLGGAHSQEAVAFFGPEEDRAAQTLLVHSSGDIEPFSAIFEAFAAANPGLRVIYEQRSTNDIYARASEACDAGRASADLLISSSIDQQFKLVNDGCAQPYRSRATDRAPRWANWRDEIFGLTREPAVIVYNKAFFERRAVPQSRFELIDLLRGRAGNVEGEFAGRIATYDIERAGVGYLFAFADAQQATTFGRLIEAFGRNDVEMLASSSALIEGVAQGEYLIAYNILGSYALARAERDPRIGVVAPSDYTLLLARAAVVLKEADSPDAAGAFIDFALSDAGRELLANESLIVDVDTDPRLSTADPAGSGSSLRPIPFTTALLAGLDRAKRRIFLETWRAGVHPPD